VYHFVIIKKFVFPGFVYFSFVSKKVKKERTEIKIGLKMQQKYATIPMKTPTSKKILLEAKVKGAVL